MSELVTLTDQQSDELKRAEAYLNGAKNFKITDDANYQNAGIMLQKIKEKKKNLDAMRKDVKSPIIAAGKKIEDMFRQPINFLTQAEEKLKTAMIYYKEAMDVKHEMHMEVAINKLEILEQEAQLALKEGDEIGFQRILVEIEELKSKTIAAPKLDGISYRDNWVGEGLDLRRTIVAISEGKAPLSLVKFDDVAINQLAKSTKGSIVYPGINIYNKQILASRRG